MEKIEPINSFEEIFEDRIVLAELEALYEHIKNAINGAKDNGEVDDWECIVADRIATLVSGEEHNTRNYCRPIRGLPK